MRFQERLREWFQENSSNHAFLEAINMWIYNPSSKSANYGGNEFWKAVTKNLAYRYSEYEVKKILREVKSTISDALYEHDAEKLEDTLSDLLDEEGEDILFKKIVEEIKSSSPLLEHVRVLAEYTEKENLWEYRLLGGNKRSINARLDRILGKKHVFDFDDFVKLGLYYKLPWVRSGPFMEKTIEYVLPSHCEDALRLVLENPVLDTPFLCSQCGRGFDSITALAEHEHTCVEQTVKEHIEGIRERLSLSQKIPECSDSSCGAVHLIRRGEGSIKGQEILNAIVQSAKEYIRLEDNFLDISVLHSLLCANPDVRIQVLTSLYYEKKERDSRNTPLFKAMGRLLGDSSASPPRLEVKETGGPWTHDRVILTETSGWAISTSIKEFVDNTKWCTISHLPQKARQYIDREFMDLWEESDVVNAQTYYDLSKRRRGRKHQTDTK